MINRDILRERVTQVWKDRVNLVAVLPSDQGDMVIKRFGWRSPIHFYTSPTFPGRAVTSWNIAQRLGAANARTPRPIFLYSRRSRGFIRENLIITELIDGHEKLRDFLKNQVPLERKIEAVADLAVSLARMHNAGIIHGDLTAGNFLVDTENKVYLVDLNRAVVTSGLSNRKRVADLARICFDADPPEQTSELIGAFFKAYRLESKIDWSWSERYADHRARLLGKRRRKARVRRLLNGK